MRILNKKAKFNYQILEKYETGISLLGIEVKSLRNGRADLSNSYAKIINGEVYLINANIPSANVDNYDATRTRKLLLKRNEIISIQSKIKARKLTLVPISLYNKGRLVKVNLALAKPKRKFEKREDLKKKDIEREIQRQLRGEKE